MVDMSRIKYGEEEYVLVLYETFYDKAQRFLLPLSEVEGQFLKDLKMNDGQYINSSDFNEEQHNAIMGIQRAFYIGEPWEDDEDVPERYTFGMWAKYEHTEQEIPESIHICCIIQLGADP